MSFAVSFILGLLALIGYVMFRNNRRSLLAKQDELQAYKDQQDAERWHKLNSERASALETSRRDYEEKKKQLEATLLRIDVHLGNKSDNPGPPDGAA